MKVGRFVVLGVTLMVLLFPFSNRAFSQEGPTPTPIPNAPSADFLVYIPFVVKQTIPQQPGTSHPRTIDHRSIDLFARIPDQYLTIARNMKVLFSDRSVGQNITESLNCLSATSWAASPSACRNDYYNSSWYWRTFNQQDLNDGIVPARIQFIPSPTRYNRSNWTYEFRMGTWTELTENFVTDLGPTYVGRGYDVLSYQFSYLNVQDNDNIANLSDGFFGDNRYDIHDLESFWARNPGRTYILWTTSLARNTGSQVAQDFNNQMRSYAHDHNMWLLDVADIEAYTDTGAPCYDNRDGVLYIKRGVDGTEMDRENYPDDHQNIPAICQDYTTETEGGHLGSVAGANIRLAKAFWVLMARIAGWNP
jgi:hypothetical protein